MTDQTVFDTEINAEEYCTKIMNAHKEAMKEGLNHLEVVGYLAANMSYDEFQVFIAALLHGQLIDGETLEDFADDAANMAGLEPSDYK